MQSVPFGVLAVQPHWPAEHPNPLQLMLQDPQLFASD
jgi:hypothetical protein